MIQELFGGGASFVGGGGERKICFNGILEASPSPSPSLSTNTNNTTVSSTPNTPTTATATNPPGGDQQNLRCPRCDSSNTKFCYYNNYNLTQPRHFCKTCRRYWTKGGALRNVPIGGGCRKNKSPLPSTTTTASVKSTTGKSKTAGEFGKPNFGFDLDSPINPILWATPQNSQLMALLRAAQSQNPNPNPNRMIKQEEAMIGSYNISSSDTSSASALPGTTSSALNAARPNGGVGVDPFGQTQTTVGFWRNNQHQNQNPNQPQPQQHALLMGDLQASGIQELFQRLRSTGNYYSDHQASNNNAVQPSSHIMEPSPITGAEVGYWNNPSGSWSNLPTPHGAFP